MIFQKYSLKQIIVTPETESLMQKVLYHTGNIYLDDLLSFNNNNYFNSIIGSIHPSKLKLTTTTDNILKSEFLNLDIEIIWG